MADIWQDLDRFSGLNNVDAPERLTPSRDADGYIYPLQTAKDIFIDDTMALCTRPGYTRKVSAVAPHSLWSNNETALYVMDDKLYSLSPTYTVMRLRDGLSIGFRMSYAELAGMIFYTNGRQVGYLMNGIDMPIPDPAQEFKLALPAGQFIGFYRSRMYVARGNQLWYSDAGAPFRIDERHGFMQMESDIVMLRPVEYGIYISDSENVYFWNCLSPIDGKLEHCKSYPAIPYTDALFDGQYYGAGKEGDQMVAFMTTRGMCVGTSKGDVVNLTESNYRQGFYTKGAGLVVPEAGKIRYLGILSK